MDYLLMTGLLMFFYLLFAHFRLSVSPVILVAMSVGSLMNPLRWCRLVPGVHRGTRTVTARSQFESHPARPIRSPDPLRFEEVAMPVPRGKEVLIKVHATSVSTGDCNMRNFTFVTKSMLAMAKLMFGIGKPWKERILGTELAEEIVESATTL